MATVGPRQYHQDALELWRSKLQAARVRYSLAAKNTQYVTRYYKASRFHSPDGALAFVQAQREESEALLECMHTLVIFADFLITGQPCPED